MNFNNFFRVLTIIFTIALTLLLVSAIVYDIFFEDLYYLSVYYSEGYTEDYVCLQRPTANKSILLDNGKYLILPDDCTFEYTCKSVYRFN